MISLCFPHLRLLASYRLFTPVKNHFFHRFNVIDALLLCLHFYSAVGDSHDIDPGQEEKLKVCNLVA